LTAYETRDYDLALLIILVVFCWPAAIIYYFTRPTVTRYTAPPPQYAQPNQPYTGPTKYCSQCGRPMPDTALYCPSCGKPQSSTNQV